MGRFLRLLVLGLTALVAGFYPLVAPLAHRIDQAHFDLIQDGMTRAEVEAILGAGSGKYDWAEVDHTDSLWSIQFLRLALRAASEDVKFVYVDLSGDVDVSSAIPVSINWRPLADTTEQWVSRHGAFTLHFDGQVRVISRRGPEAVRIEAPWQRWWRTLTKS